MSQSQRPDWLQWLDSCPSTNTWAIAHLSRLHHGDVVFTPQQTAGRGQHSRIWRSPSGVLTASFVLEISIIQRLELPLLAGLAVIYAVEDLLPDCQGLLRLKWPNDVLLHGHKLAGILCEGSQGAVVVGIGLNCCAVFDSAELAGAASLHQISATLPSELALLERLRHYLLQTAGLLRHSTGLTGRSPGLLPALRQRDALLGQSILLELNGETIAGEAAGISDQGYLLLRLPTGEVRSFVSGHILQHNLS